MTRRFCVHSAYNTLHILYWVNSDFLFYLCWQKKKEKNLLFCTRSTGLSQRISDLRNEPDLRLAGVVWLRYRTKRCLSSENKGLNTEQDFNGIISLAELDFPILISAYRKKKNWCRTFFIGSILHISRTALNFFMHLRRILCNLQFPLYF